MSDVIVDSAGVISL